MATTTMTKTVDLATVSDAVSDAAVTDICANCDLSLDKCKKDLWCVYCSGCGRAKTGCICAICIGCTKMRTECVCTCTICDCAIKECTCPEQDDAADYCVYCMNLVCSCDAEFNAEYVEYMSGKDVCRECGAHHSRCDCAETTCIDCGSYHHTCDTRCSYDKE